ncbi:hypothetical protein [Natronoflexus pectinivorans]|uniref:hypothetical protein n=1 Tax=Natronoflexus pectinivorans TaxID=682526 RepID=UPI00140548EE|nr:hypothetical protein [Natronoflexus pectinivorans]
MTFPLFEKNKELKEADLREIDRDDPVNIFVFGIAADSIFGELMAVIFQLRKNG